MLLSIIVLTHNSASIIETCLNSILKECEKLSFEIMVVDNDSCDNTASIVQKKYPNIKLIANHKNLGVAAARNIGIKAATGRYILLLDDDIVVHKNSIVKLLEIINSSNSIGLIAPQLQNPDGTIQYNGLETPSLGNKLKRISKKLLRIKLNSKYQESINNNSEYYPDYLIGAAQLFRNDLIKTVGLLDEKIFYGPEDADFCLRISKLKYKVMCYPEARMTHSYQRRSYKFKQLPILLKHFKALLYFWNKHRIIN